MFLQISAGTLDFHADLFRCLSDRSRLMILNALCAGPLNVGAIVSVTQFSQSSVSGHLHELSKFGLVKFEKRGRFVQYRLGDTWASELPQSNFASENFLAARAVFLSKLREAKQFGISEEKHTFEKPEFQILSYFMMSTLEYLRSDSDIVAEKLDEPLLRFIVNLGDLSEGRQPEILKPQSRLKSKSLLDQSVMVLAALALDELVTGLGEPVDQAAAKVARVIQAAKLPVRSRRGAKLANTIRGWRDRIYSAPSPVLHLWQDYHRDPSRFGASPAKRVEWLLNRLRHGTELHWC